MKQAKYSFEQYLAILGAVACLVITILIWRAVSLQQPMWPLPGLYFIEIPAICMAAAGLLLSGGALGRAAVWGSAGILFGFSLLGVFSVGIYYFPVALLLMFTSLAADIRVKQPILAHLGIFLAAGMAQVGLMLAAIWLLYK